MSPIRCAISVAAIVVSLSPTLFAKTLTVSKAGGGMYSSIQAAVVAAGPGDEVVILDSAVYAEQVTIDSTKSGLVLRSEKPRIQNKPTILFQDKINVGPKTTAESLVDSLITYYRNGALQILGAAHVRIEGIAIDGGGVYPFGGNGIWESKYPFQSGNAAFVLWKAGDVIISDCDISNAYYGINVIDRNDGGFFANPNPSDSGPQIGIPYYGLFRTGNHLIEHNRIHDNSYGFNFQLSWDLGSTIRYNLIYENHHATAAIAVAVKALTSEGGNQTGGAFVFKDDMLSPLSIYNNTFWHNSLIFSGNWKAGGQHLIFNNIYGAPDQYFDRSTTTFNTMFEMSKCFANRMHNCVYAAMQQAPTPNYTTITNDLKPAATGGTFTEGSLITPFPASAEVRWVETKFQSTNPTDANFLTPDWSNEHVLANIVDKGWVEAGVKDPDGSRADLGAIPSGGGRPVDIVTIRPNKPVEIKGSTAVISFNATVRLMNKTAKDPTIIYFASVTKLDTSDVFGADYKAIPTTNISKIAIPATKIVLGDNTIEVPVPTGGTGDFAFFEMIIEATGTDGQLFTTAVGFIPYRPLPSFQLEVTILDKIGGTPLTTVHAGVPVVLRVIPRNGATEFTDKIDPTDVMLQSRFELRNPTGGTFKSIPGGIAGTTGTDVVFTRVPRGGGVEYVHVAGSWMSNGKLIAFLGSSQGVTVLAGSADSVVLIAPTTKQTSVINSGTTELVKVQAFDKYGNPVDSACAIKVVSLKPEIGKISDTIQQTGISGISTHHAWVTGGDNDQIFPIVASLVSKPAMTDTAYFKIGQPTAAAQSTVISTAPRHHLCELIDLRGRVLRQQSGLVSVRDNHSLIATVSRGIYLFRTTDIATGKVTMRRMAVLGR